MEFKTREELLSYARELEGKSINQALIDNEKHIDYVYDFKTKYKGKGSYGEYLEERYFGKKNDTESKPDFENIGIELKASPLKKLQSGELTVKERLVLNKFTFSDIASETFETSHFISKNAHLLLIFYMYDKTVENGDVIVDLVDIWDTLEHDLDQLKEDWNYIVDKIKKGKAHLLSEGDTILLGACTKGASKAESMQKQPYSDVLAPGRALCFKSSYIKSIYKSLCSKERENIISLQDGIEWKRLDVLIHEKVDKFYGISGKVIASSLGKVFNPKNKSMYARLSRFMLGLFHKNDTYREFEAGNIQIKSIRIEANGTVIESMSFRNIFFKDIVEEEWEDSIFYEELTSKFIFMFFKKHVQSDEIYYFDGFLLWNMPQHDIEKAKIVWLDTQEKIKRGDYSHFLLSGDNEVAHVRPKATKQNPYMETPQGTLEKKKCFWLNNEYIRKIVANREPFEQARVKDITYF